MWDMLFSRISKNITTFKYQMGRNSVFGRNLIAKSHQQRKHQNNLRNVFKSNKVTRTT